MTDIAIVGLGPAGLDRVAPHILGLLLDDERTVVVRTEDHPAAAELAGRRPVVFCDDLYRSSGGFDDVYAAIADRVLALAARGAVTYAVPGSAVVGERAVAMIRRSQPDVTVVPGESFLDLACAVSGIDPITDGIQVVDGRSLPDPLPLHLPTFVTQVDSPYVAAEVAVALGRLLPDDTTILLLDRLGDPDQVVAEVPLRELPGSRLGPRTTLLVRRAPVGWLGLVETNRRLRSECPWDREQTHHTLLSHLIEEAYETVDAISHLSAEAPGGGDADYGAYAVVEEELGDLLLQVVFHATLAREAGAFDVDDVAEGIRRKLVRRHPHVFSDVEVSGAAEVLANWEALKHVEKERSSLMDDIPAAIPGIHRADKLQRRAAGVGFDWPSADPVFDKVREELAELRAESDAERRTDELGDLLFAIVNLSRHLAVDPEIALARANDRFAQRFRAMELQAAADGAGLGALSLEELDELWEQAKRTE